MIPAGRLVALAAVPVLVSIAYVAADVALWLALAVDAAVLLVAVVDAWMLEDALTARMWRTQHQNAVAAKCPRGPQEASFATGHMAERKGELVRPLVPFRPRQQRRQAWNCLDRALGRGCHGGRLQRRNGI